MGASTQKFPKMFNFSIMGSKEPIYVHNQGIYAYTIHTGTATQSLLNWTQVPQPLIPLPLGVCMGICAHTLTPRGTFMHLVGWSQGDKILTVIYKD